MANRRVIDGKDTPTRIQEAWDNIVKNDEYPNVTDFAKKADVSVHTFNHRYKNWADKIRKRRDEGRGRKRKLSPASISKNSLSSLELKQVEEQVHTLQKQIQVLRNELDKKEVEFQKIKIKADEVDRLTEKNSRLLGSIDYLYSQLIMHGATQEQINTIRKAVNNHLSVIEGRNK